MACLNAATPIELKTSEIVIDTDEDQRNLLLII